MNAVTKNHFYKMHGAGNDFIIIDNRSGAFDATNHRKIKKMCAHHTGIGADGFMLISESDKKDFKLEYFNANGLPAEMCGNGARCAVSLAHRLKLAPPKCSFEIGDKNYQAEVLKNGFVRLRMGSSTFGTLPTVRQLEHLRTSQQFGLWRCGVTARK